MQMYFDAVMGKLSWAIASLRELPGRKAIVLFTDGLAIPRRACLNGNADHMVRSMKNVADQANHAGVVFYTFDVHGLETGRFDASFVFAPVIAGRPIVTGALPPSVTDYMAAKSAWSLALQEGTSYLAGETGGRYFHNTNGLSEALGKSLDDMNGYYLIGYRPSDDDFASKGGQVPYHKIEVKLRRRGLAMRYTKGFYGTPDASGKDAQPGPETRSEELRKAMFSPFDSGGVKVRLTPIHSASPPGEGTGKRRPLLQAMLSIDGSDLRMTDAADGKKNVVLDIVIATYKADNKLVSSQAKVYTVDMSPEQVERLAAGITYQLDIEVPDPGAYQIRVAVRDEASGLSGSASSFIVIPDFNKPQMAMSSVLLTDADNSGLLSNAASRKFHAGSSLLYACRLYGAKRDAATGKQEIEVAARLFRDGVPVHDTGFTSLAPAAGADEIGVAGTLNLPATLPEGEYAVELIARDRMANPKKQEVSQWTDLTLLRANH
jgi:hypothetical protein